MAMQRLFGGHQNISQPATWRGEIAKTANYVVQAKDNGFLFTNTGAGGAVTFTLPALRPGMCIGFYSVVDQNMTIVAETANTIVAVNDAEASSVAFSTSSQKIGSFGVFFSNKAGTKWYFENRSTTTATLT